jgi:hypothetical protein
MQLRRLLPTTYEICDESSSISHEKLHKFVEFFKAQLGRPEKWATGAREPEFDPYFPERPTSQAQRPSRAPSHGKRPTLYHTHPTMMSKQECATNTVSCVNCTTTNWPRGGVAIVTRLPPSTAHGSGHRAVRDQTEYLQRLSDGLVQQTQTNASHTAIKSAKLFKSIYKCL